MGTPRARRRDGDSGLDALATVARLDVDRAHGDVGVGRALDRAALDDDLGAERERGAAQLVARAVVGNAGVDLELELRLRCDNVDVVTPAGTPAAREQHEHRPRHRRILCHALALGAVALPAHADDRVIGGGITLGYGGALEALHFDARMEPGAFLRLGRFEATLALPLTYVSSSAIARDGHQLEDLAGGLRVAYHQPLTPRAFATVALGVERHWLWGNEPLTRECRITKTCLAGYYMETASYRGWAAALRLGAGVETAFPTIVAGGTVELVVVAMKLDGVGRGVTALGTITLAVGGRARAPSPYR